MHSFNILEIVLHCLSTSRLAIIRRLFWSTFLGNYKLFWSWFFVHKSFFKKKNFPNWENYKCCLCPHCTNIATFHYFSTMGINVETIYAYSGLWTGLHIELIATSHTSEELYTQENHDTRHDRYSFLKVQLHLLNYSAYGKKRCRYARSDFL